MTDPLELANQIYDLMLDGDVDEAINLIQNVMNEAHNIGWENAKHVQTN